MVFWAVQPRSSPTRIGQHFSNFNQYISLISSDNVISQSPISSLLVHVCASKVKNFWSRNHFHVNTGWDKPGPAESWCSPLTPINSSWTDPGCQVFQPPFRPFNRAPNLPWTPKGEAPRENTELPLCWPVKAGAYIQIYIIYMYIYIDWYTWIIKHASHLCIQPTIGIHWLIWYINGSMKILSST